MMRFLLVLALVALAAAKQVRRDGWQVLTAEVETLEQASHFKQMMDNGIDFWEEPSHIGRNVTFVQPPTQTGINGVDFFHLGIDAHVVRENLQDDYDAAEEYIEWYHANHDPDTHYEYDLYNPYDVIMEELVVLEGACPAGFTCNVRNIGNSYAGNPLLVFSISSSAAVGTIWMDSTIHAREWLSTATNMNMLRLIVTGTDATADYLRRYNWYFLPVMNPDGYIYTWTNNRMWRKSRSPNFNSNCIGTDLNRNYPVNWGASGASTNPCSDTFMGDSPSSNIETEVVIAEGMRLRGTLDAWLTIHTYGNYLLIPYGNCNFDPVEYDLQMNVTDAMANAIEGTYGTRWLRGNSCMVLYATSGSTSDWSLGDAQAFISMTPELRGGRFDPPTSAILPSVTEFLNGLVAMVAAMDNLNLPINK